MSYEELDDNIVFAADPLASKPAAKSNADIRQNLVKVESALTEFESVNAGLAALAERYPVDAVIDVTTGKGMVEAVAHRAAWRDPRLAVERIRKQAKAPVIALGKDIDARAAWITEQLLIGEVPMDRQIKAEEARKEAIKQERINAEAGRILAIQEAIAEIGMVAMAAAGKSAAHIAELIESQRAEVLSLGVFQEMLPQAQAAQNACLVKLDLLHKAALHTESEAAKLAAERAELEALRKAAAEQKAKDEAAAKVEQERVAAEHVERQRVMNEQAAELKAMQDAASAQQAEIDRQREVIARTAVAAIRWPEPKLESTKAPAIVSLVATNNAARAAIAESSQPAGQSVEVEWINTTALSERVGIPMNGALAEEIGHPGTKRAGPGLFWDASHVPAIGLSLIDRIRSRISASVAA